MEDYYTTSNRKTGDFFIGVGISIAFAAINSILSFFFSWIFNLILSNYSSNNTMAINGSISVICWNILSFIIAVASVVYFFRIKRRFIGIGEIVGLVTLNLLPLLAVGACLVLFSAMG